MDAWATALVPGTAVLVGGTHSSGVGWLPWSCGRRDSQCATTGGSGAVGGILLDYVSEVKGAFWGENHLYPYQVDGGGTYGRHLILEGIIVNALRPPCRSEGNLHP